jgi:hypothetical protein
VDIAMSKEDQPVEVFAGESFEAGRVQSLLEAEGVRAVLVGENLGTTAPYMAVGGGVAAVRVIVPRASAEQALRLIKEHGLAEG